MILGFPREHTKMPKPQQLMQEKHLNPQKARMDLAFYSRPKDLELKSTTNEKLLKQKENYNLTADQIKLV